MILTIDPDYPGPHHIHEAARTLRAGGVLAYPTDTNYGLGCLVNERRAVERLYNVRGVEATKAMSLICGSFEQVSEYAVVDNAAYRLMRRHLPGPYTFILHGTGLAPKGFSRRQRRITVGIRLPAHPFVRALMRDIPAPLLNTSVPLADGELSYDPAVIDDTIGWQIDLVIDGGPLVAEPSTVVDLTSGAPEIVRAGKGPIEALF